MKLTIGGIVLFLGAAQAAYPDPEGNCDACTSYRSGASEGDDLYCQRKTDRRLNRCYGADSDRCIPGEEADGDYLLCNNVIDAEPTEAPVSSPAEATEAPVGSPTTSPGGAWTGLCNLDGSTCYYASYYPSCNANNCASVTEPPTDSSCPYTSLYCQYYPAACTSCSGTDYIPDSATEYGAYSWCDASSTYYSTCEGTAPSSPTVDGVNAYAWCSSYAGYDTCEHQYYTGEATYASYTEAYAWCGTGSEYYSTCDRSDYSSTPDYDYAAPYWCSSASYANSYYPVCDSATLSSSYSGVAGQYAPSWCGTATSSYYDVCNNELLNTQYTSGTYAYNWCSSATNAYYDACQTEYIKTDYANQWAPNWCSSVSSNGYYDVCDGQTLSTTAAAGSYAPQWCATASSQYYDACDGESLSTQYTTGSRAYNWCGAASTSGLDVCQAQSLKTDWVNAYAPNWCSSLPSNKWYNVCDGEQISSGIAGLAQVPRWCATASSDYFDACDGTSIASDYVSDSYVPNWCGAASSYGGLDVCQGEYLSTNWAQEYVPNWCQNVPSSEWTNVCDGRSLSTSYTAGSYAYNWCSTVSGYVNCDADTLSVGQSGSAPSWCSMVNDVAGFDSQCNYQTILDLSNVADWCQYVSDSALQFTDACGGSSDGVEVCSEPAPWCPYVPSDMIATTPDCNCAAPGNGLPTCSPCARYRSGSSPNDEKLCQRNEDNYCWEFDDKDDCNDNDFTLCNNILMLSSSNTAEETESISGGALVAIGAAGGAGVVGAALFAHNKRKSMTSDALADFRNDV